MPEIDPVILELRADLDRYLGAVRRATRTVDQQLGAQEKRVKRLEQEMRRSADSIKGQFRSLAGALAGYFTGRELVGLLDSFTRLQNNLRVAGLEGDALKAVQDRLFESAQKYGVEIEGLSKLFSSLSQSSKELGANQAQLFALTDSVSAALKISGISAQEASGALLQLGQALRGGKLQAEEYNSLLDGLYPLLEAAATGSDRWGGSVAKLTADVKAGKVSSQEFFQAILGGADVLEGKAAKASLTLSSGITTLTNALTVYFGEADKANGVSAALGAALQVLADNLDVLIPAIATISTYLGVRYVVSAIAASGATAALIAHLQIATTSMAGLALASRSAGASLIAALGGPVGAAILAVGAAIYIADKRIRSLSEGTGRYKPIEDAATGARDKARDAAEKLATATGKARDAALQNAQAIRQETIQLLANARAQLTVAKAKAQAAAADAKGSLSEGAVNVVGPNPLRPLVMAFGGGAQGEKVRTQADVTKLEGVVKGLEGSIAALNGAINPPSVQGVSAGTPGSNKGAGSSGRSAADITRQFNDELAGYSQQYNSAMASMAKSASEQAEFELRNVELARLRTVDAIQADADYSKAQKELLVSTVNQVAEVERARIELAKKAQLEREANDLADEEYRAQADALSVQYDLADSQTERKRLALEMLDLEYRHKAAILDGIIASEATTEAEKERAKIARKALDAMIGGQREGASRANETPMDRYLRDLNKSPEAINEAIDSIKIDGLNALNDGLVDAIMGAKSLGDVFKNVANQIIADLLRIAIQQAIIKPLADLLGGGGGGGGGGILGFLGTAASLFGGGSRSGAQSLIDGRASGGPVRGGQMYRVNEAGAPGRVEGFIPQGSGQIIPLGRMNALQGGAQGQQGMATVRLELSGDIDARIQSVSGPVAIEVVRASAPGIVDAASRETMKRAGRPRI